MRKALAHLSLVAMVLVVLATTVEAQPPFGPPFSFPPSGGGAGVTGLTSCDGGTALADNLVMRADGTTGCQGSLVTISDAGVISTAAGTALALTATAPTQTTNAQAGISATITTSAAVDGASGHAAQNGGNFAISLGAGVNAGKRGSFKIDAPSTGYTASNPLLWFGDITGGAGGGIYESAGEIAFESQNTACFRYGAGSGVQYATGCPVVGFSRAAGFTGAVTAFSSPANGVMALGTGAANAHDAFMVSGGTCIVASDQTNATTTPQTWACYNTTSGTVAIALAAGRTYIGRCTAYVSDSTAADGATLDLDASTATVTNLQAGSKLFGPTVAEDAYLRTTALATDMPSGATLTGSAEFDIELYILVNAAGTFQPRFFQKAHSTGTLTLSKGSFCQLVDATP